MGAELCLAHDMGGVEAYGGPLSVDMQPYGCFILMLSSISRRTLILENREKNECNGQFNPEIL